MADIELVQGDTGPDIEGTLRLHKDDAALDLTEAVEVRFQMRRVDGHQYAIDREAEIMNAALGKVMFVVMEGDLVQWGDFIAQWEIHWNDGTTTTTNPPNTVYVRRQ